MVGKGFRKKKINKVKDVQTSRLSDKRVSLGARGGGEYFRILVRPKDQFEIFRYHDVGDRGHIQRLSGKRNSGSWATHAWLIHKKDAHISGSTLIADAADAKRLLKTLGSKPKHLKADFFEAKDRPNIPEKEKPTMSHKKA